MGQALAEWVQTATLRSCWQKMSATQGRRNAAAAAGVLLALPWGSQLACISHAPSGMHGAVGLTVPVTALLHGLCSA